MEPTDYDEIPRHERFINAYCPDNPLPVDERMDYQPEESEGE